MSLPRLLAYAVFILATIFCAARVYCDENRRPAAHEIKAAYIYNFAKFVEWPNARFQKAGESIHVCVFGDDPIGPSLEAIEGKTAGNKKVSIKQITSLQNVRGCEILFISNSEEAYLAKILKVISGSPILTIGDTEGFAEQGVIINFYLKNRTVRFEINPKAAIRAGLRISSNLLRIAKIVAEP
jgi:hypothetical protein